MGARVLVTGGSGFLGQHLVRELQAAGAEVLGLSRSAASDAVLAGGSGACSARADRRRIYRVKVRKDPAWRGNEEEEESEE